MKKIFIVLLMLVCWTSMCGFKNVESGVVLAKSGEVTEIIYFEYDQTDATNMGITLDELNDDMLEIVQDTINDLNLKIKNTIDANYEGNDVLKSNIIVSGGVDSEKHYAIIKINFANKTIWDCMCFNSAEANTPEIQKSLFTSTYTYSLNAKLSKVDTVLGKISTFEAVCDYIKLNSLFNSLTITTFPATYQYSYSTTSKRLHSNAPSQQTYLLSGIYEHTWTFNYDENPEIELYQTVANATTWYILALLLTGGFVVVLLIVSKYKKKKPDIAEILGED